MAIHIYHLVKCISKTNVSSKSFGYVGVVDNYLDFMDRIHPVYV